MHLHLVYALLWLICFCLFIFSVALFCFYKKILKKFKDQKIQKRCVFCVYIDTYVPWMAIETKCCKLCIFCSLDEHLYTQLRK